MEFKKFSTSTAGFCVMDEEEKKVKGDADAPIDFVNNPHGLIFKQKQDLKEAAVDYYHADYKGIQAVLMHLAICHTVVVDKNKGVYNAASPDE